MKLLTKYSMANLIVMVGVFLVSCLVLYKFTQLILIREMNADLAGVETQVTDYVKEYNSYPEGYPMDEVIISFEKTGKNKIERKSELTQMFSTRENKMHNFMKLDYPLWFGGSWNRVTIAKPLEGMHHLTRALITISLSTIFIIILISLLLNRLLLRRLWKPFYESMDIMRNFKLEDNESLVFPATSTEEFAFMNDSLALAAAKAKHDYLLLKEFTENASHEMQTPLSIIRSKLDMLIQEKDLSLKQSELAREAYSSIKKLARLNYSLLLLAKIENQQFDNMLEVSLKEKVEDKIDQFREFWLSNQITVEQLLNESSIIISPELLDILLNNLFSNASNHNTPSGKIYIELKKNKFTISNSGSQIPLDEKKLFTRFYKTEVNSNHNGLGLAIIRQISRVSAIQILLR
jgi:signal transduction histidine kinase